MCGKFSAGGSNREKRFAEEVRASTCEGRQQTAQVLEGEGESWFTTISFVCPSFYLLLYNSCAFAPLGFVHLSKLGLVVDLIDLSHPPQKGSSGKL